MLGTLVFKTGSSHKLLSLICTRFCTAQIYKLWHCLNSLIDGIISTVMIPVFDWIEGIPTGEDNPSFPNNKMKCLSQGLGVPGRHDGMSRTHNRSHGAGRFAYKLCRKQPSCQRIYRPSTTPKTEECGDKSATPKTKECGNGFEHHGDVPIGLFYQDVDGIGNSQYGSPIKNSQYGSHNIVVTTWNFDSHLDKTARIFFLPKLHAASILKIFFELMLVTFAWKNWNQREEFSFASKWSACNFGFGNRMKLHVMTGTWQK